MAEEKKGVEEKEPNANMSAEEILKFAPKEEAEPSQESPPEKKPSEETTEVSEGVKTPEVESEEKESPIPYSRFKEVNEEKNQYKSEKEKLEESLEEAQAILNDPEVLRIVRQKQGFSGEEIEAELKELGHEPITEVKSDFDLTKTEGWKDYIDASMQKALKPIKETLTQIQQGSKERQVQEQLVSWEAEAKVLAKGLGIEYGESGKTEKDPNTAIGKISKYIDNHPEDARLGHPKLLKLALAEEGFKFGEQKGVVKEKARQEKLKSVAMEGAPQPGTEDYPQPDWSTERILDWKAKHPET